MTAACSGGPNKDNERSKNMQRSETIKELAIALNSAQKEMKAAVKDATNPHFRSKYADLGSVVEAVRAPLLKHGITFLQGVQDAEGGVAIETMLLHVSGEWISSTLRLPATKQDAQGYGSAITYGRRYGLQAICGIPAEDDDGNAASKPQITPRAGAVDSLTVDRRTQFQDIANGVKAELSTKGPESAYKLLNEESAHAGIEDATEKAALWDMFDSKERAALTKVGQQLKKAA